jgi:superfamily II DNA/RNA helicase
MIAQSQSGTGKTAAFVLAMLSRVDPSKPYPQVGPATYSVLLAAVSIFILYRTGTGII